MKSADRLVRWLAALLLAVVITPLTARAEDDPPGRVGRVADTQGSVSLYDNEQGQWVPAPRNRPLTSGDRLSTDDGGRAELRIGSTTLRLAPDSELEILRIDDQRVSVQLHSGGLALRIRSREVADETEVVTAETRLRPLRSGHFRVDRIDDTTYAGSWRGELRVDDGGDPFTIDNGRRAEIWREGSGRDSLRHRAAALPNDDFGSWVLAEDKRDERTASNRYVSPEMTGAEDLDRNGRWEQHPEYGAVWIPTVVVAGWAPYRYGHWAWVAPWGWTWVDDAPWGFAPFHYGRWVSWGGRWCWYPGVYVRRPVYAPALVAWVGGPSVSISVSIGGPPVGWVPLAPREVYVPYYRVTPVYRDRINRPPPGGWRPQVPNAPIHYSNQGVPGAVTVVPRDVLERRQPVARAVIDVREPARQPVAPVTAPAGPRGEAMPAPRPRNPAEDGRPLRPRPQPVVPGQGGDRGDRGDRGGDRGDRGGDRGNDRPQRPQPGQPQVQPPQGQPPGNRPPQQAVQPVQPRPQRPEQPLQPGQPPQQQQPQQPPQQAQPPRVPRPQNRGDDDEPRQPPRGQQRGDNDEPRRPPVQREPQPQPQQQPIQAQPQRPAPPPAAAPAPAPQPVVRPAPQPQPPREQPREQRGDDGPKRGTPEQRGNQRERDQNR